jgi:hypothetical protein
MKKYILLLIVLIQTMVSCDKETLDKVLNNNTQLTNEEVIAALKEALNVGTDTSVSILNKVDGYFKDEAVKILLPEEAKVVYEQLSKIPGGNALLDRTVLSINRAAEDAASEAKPIFVNAITTITIADGFTILNGSDTAATSYLHGKTYNPLYGAFQPKIDVSLSKPMVLGYSAQESYQSLIDAYNTASLNGILFDKITTNSLSEHVTRKGLDGLFLKVADQEMKIRKDPIAQVTDLLKKVFGSKK